MRRILPAGLLVLLVGTPAIAQPSTIRPGDIRCPDCAVSGQKPAAAAFDASQIEFVANPTPAFYRNQTIRFSVIARVLQPAPLILDVLDSRTQTLDRKMRVVATGWGAANDSRDCLFADPNQPVDLASKAVVSALRLNDIVTADIILNRDPQMPESILGATPTLTNVRKAAAPVRFFHTGQVTLECANRSGRLVEYGGSDDGELTIVYNDGGIYYRNGAYLTFARERLSPAELSDLLRAFRDANFDAMPTTFPQRQSANRPSLTLTGARYQRVALRDGDARLAPLLERIDALAGRATAHAHYLLKSAPGVPIVVKPWAEADVDLARLADAGMRLSEGAPAAWRRLVPPDVIRSLPAETVAPQEGDRDPNRLVYFGQAGRLFRVATRAFCADAAGCAFRELNAAEVTEPAFGNCEPGTTNCQMTIYADGRREHTRWDPPLTVTSGRLWPRSMGVKLRDVPPSGLTFSTDEYNRHKAIYLPIMKLRQSGPNYIEDGILYAHVRVCLIEEGGDPATCEGTTRNGAVRQPQPAAVTRAEEAIRAQWSSGDLLIQVDCQRTAVIDEFLQAYFAKYPSDL